MHRLVVFDIDDTLYLEREYVRSGFDAVGVWARTELGVADLGARAWETFESGVRGRIFDEALAACGVASNGSLVSCLVDVYRSHEPAIAVLDDVRTWLAACPADIALAVVTDGPPISQRLKATALGLGDWADPIIVTEELGSGRCKPHPAAFERVEAATGLTGGACAYVGDNPAKDFGGPRGRGWRTVRVRRRDGLHAAVASGADVDAEIAGFATLDDALGWWA